MPAVLTPEDIEAVIAALPAQARVMLRLLLLQYLDVTAEDIAYIAADRPDPRMLAGVRKTQPVVTRDAIQGVTDRVAQYQTRVRHRRERGALQTECIGKQMALLEARGAAAERLLTSRFGLTKETVLELKRQARTAVPKPALRALERRWEQDEITEDEYRRDRLVIEYQGFLRRLDRERRRLEMAKREIAMHSAAPLQDHEIAHIWGIPSSSLAARKVKALNLYLQGLQARLQQGRPPTEQAVTVPLDLWKETFHVLAQRPVPRSAAVYDGLEGTEEALMEKLAAYVANTLPEEIEGRFWGTMVQDSLLNAETGDQLRSMFALQRLSALLSEVDTSPEALEEDLLARVAPTPKEPVARIEAEPAKPAPGEAELGQMAEHVLRSFRGDDRR
ncbi:hypothetical protein [Nitrospira sp. Kam-Ns4a]